MKVSRVVILDGYTDEPAGLGVPPYIGTYPRLIAGSLWLHDKSIRIHYFTIDEARKNPELFVNKCLESDQIYFIAGAEVPGRYIGGKPITLEEIERFSILLSEKTRILVGPAAKFGLGLGGGSQAYSRKRLERLFDHIVPGDIEIFITEALKHGFERAEPWRLRENYTIANEAFRLGSAIIRQHPNYGWNLIVEIETFRGCPRYVTGGCSFCIEPRYGNVLFREPKDVIKEIEALYQNGAIHFRIGKQPDILAYKAIDTGKEEFPKPNIRELEKLFHGIRSVAPGLKVLHIDNVNPGTIAHHPETSREALKIIIKYHTPGDVAALGIESFDPKVIKRNNLKVMPEEALAAIRIINEIGARRGWNGLPELLPGVNLLYGLPGETKETYRINYEYLKKILDEGLLLRRINIRKVSVLENTPLWARRDEVNYLIKKHDRLYRSYRIKIMQEIDQPMMKRLVPPNIIVKYLFTETYQEGFTIARQPASYPIVFKIRGKIELKKIVSVKPIKYASKSILAEIIGEKEISNTRSHHQ
ncbi:radical SAM protein [Desulfurococcaceae archaeon MEX13E-LK6-19]|nr:radical SAM protein [Desulfurococcaceae archaeon MEX13E-LK6-19]